MMNSIEGLRVLGEVGESSQEVQTSIYKISKYWGCSVQRNDCS